MLLTTHKVDIRHSPHAWQGRLREPVCRWLQGRWRRRGRPARDGRWCIRPGHKAGSSRRSHTYDTPTLFKVLAEPMMERVPRTAGWNALRPHHGATRCDTASAARDCPQASLVEQVAPRVCAPQPPPPILEMIFSPPRTGLTSEIIFAAETSSMTSPTWTHAGRLMRGRGGAAPGGTYHVWALEHRVSPGGDCRTQGGHVGRRQERAAAEVYEGKLASVDPRHRGRPASSPAGHSAVRLRRSVRFRRSVPYTGRVGRPCRWD